MERIPMTRMIGGLQYDTEKATLVAHDVFWDGHNMERHGRNTWLYRTKKGRYFTVTRTMWQGERDELTPVTDAEAMRLYDDVLPEHVTGYDDAFPDCDPSEA